MDDNTLIKRLREGADEVINWDDGRNPAYSDWSDLMEEAANALEDIGWDEL